MTSMVDLGAPLVIDVEGLRIRCVRSASDGETTPVLLVSPFPESLYASTTSGQTYPRQHRWWRSTDRALVSPKAAQS
jgi:hypothetical protein